MKNLFLVLCISIFSLVNVFAQNSNEHKKDSILVISNEQEKNIVALHMEGEWSYEVMDEEKPYETGIIFQKDTTILTLIPKKYYDFLVKNPIYAAGYMIISSKKDDKMEEKKVPFLLTTLFGNPHIVWFRERGGDPLGDAESFNVFIPSTGEKENDIMYLGGDMPHEPFRPFKRVK